MALRGYASLDQKGIPTPILELEGQPDAEVLEACSGTSAHRDGTDWTRRLESCGELMPAKNGRDRFRAGYDILLKIPLTKPGVL
jgi:hypothetical protein